MANLCGEIPKEEIESQLKRMLESPRFLKAPSRAEFLKIVVEKALNGERSKGFEIGLRIYGSDFDPKVHTNVRVTAANLRSTLDEYYQNEGQGDRIIIQLPGPPKEGTQLPDGVPYTPLFAVNLRHPSTIALRRGHHHLRRMLGKDVLLAMDYYDAARGMAAFINASLIGTAESLCLSAIHEVSIQAPAELFECAEELLREAVRSQPENWRSHAAMGATLFCMGRWEAAQAEFHNALKIDKGATERYGWYPIFLMTNAYTSEALSLVRRYAAEEVENATAQAFLGLFLYVMRSYEEAETVLKTSLSLDPHCWLAHNVSAFLYATIDRADEGLAHLLQLAETAQEKTLWMMPGLFVVCILRAKHISTDDLLAKLNHATTVLIEAAYRPAHFQIALSQMARSESCDPEIFSDVRYTAVLELEEAIGDMDVPAFWFHIWPILDPLRDDPAFHDLMKRAGLPVDFDIRTCNTPLL